MSNLIPLRIDEQKGWRNEDLPPPIPVSKAAPLWRARQGRKIHRPLRGMIYFHAQGYPWRRSHMSMTWYCGNQSNNPIVVKPECMEGLEACQLCEFKFSRETGNG